jgi:HSP20 family molecular chaperone IbpA
MTMALEYEVAPMAPFGPSASGEWLRDDPAAGAVTFRVEWREGLREVVVKVALGWVVADSIEVDCGARSLRIGCERNVPACEALEAGGAARRGGSLRQSIPLPCEVRPGGAVARFRRGVLTVRIPTGASVLVGPPFP